MKILMQIGILFALCLAGEAISMVLPFPMPGSLIGLLILVVLFAVRAIKPNALDETGDFLLSNMSVFFVPITVSIMAVIDVVAKDIWVVLLICIVSTVVTFIATAYTVKLVMFLQQKAGRAKN